MSDEENEKIQEAIKDYLENIPKPDESDPDREKKIFTYLYLRMAFNISYDYKAELGATQAGFIRDRLTDRVFEAYNLARWPSTWFIFMFWLCKDSRETFN